MQPSTPRWSVCRTRCIAAKRSADGKLDRQPNPECYRARRACSRRCRRPRRPQERTVNFYNWSNYMAPGVLEDFTRETGIKVVYDTFDANETLETRLLAGKSGYDVVVPTAYFLQRQITAKVFQKLDKSKLPNLANAWPEVTKRLAIYDPGNQICRQLHVGHDRHRLQRQGGAENSRARRQDRQLGYRLQAGESGEIQGLRHSHAGFRRRYFSGGAGLSRARSEFDQTGGPRKGRRSRHQDQALCPQVSFIGISERAWPPARFASWWAGRATSCRREAARRKPRTTSRSATPSRKRARRCFSTIFAIPADAKNVTEAYELINYLYRPEVAAKNSDFLSYANGNLASQKLVDPNILNDKNIYPDEATLKKLFVITARDPATQRVINRLWTKVKTGR